MSRGNRRSAAEVEARLGRVAKHVAEGRTAEQIAAAEGVSVSSVQRDLQRMHERLAAENLPEYERARQEHLGKLRLIEDWVLRDAATTAPEKRDEWLKVLDRISRALGLDAPSRSMVAHVSSESSPLYLKFKKATAGLSEEQVEEVLRFAEGLTRERREPVKDASWWPQPPRKEIPDGSA